MTETEELIGADYTEHNIQHPGVGVSRAVSVLAKHDAKVDLNLIPVGKNKGELIQIGEELQKKTKKTEMLANLIHWPRLIVASLVKNLWTSLVRISRFIQLYSEKSTYLYMIR